MIERLEIMALRKTLSAGTVRTVLGGSALAAGVTENAQKPSVLSPVKHTGKDTHMRRTGRNHGPNFAYNEYEKANSTFSGVAAQIGMEMQAEADTATPGQLVNKKFLRKGGNYTLRAMLMSQTAASLLYNRELEGGIRATEAQADYMHLRVINCGVYNALRRQPRPRGGARELGSAAGQ
ncbi:hypothetical protein DL769_003892 [Monosporascus sp. CRB-8-3]|nr:hypothetical protein DL769_003892 [Monosporascus sp. CRB-8-3]